MGEVLLQRSARSRAICGKSLRNFRRSEGMTQADADALRDQVHEIISKRVIDLGGRVS